jgi:RNA polymerase sigma-70 factor (ECF subfamily)
MSSEAAYFPDSLASKPEALRMGSSAPRTPTEILNEDETPSIEPVHPAAAVIQISEISDELLLERVRAGDKEALGILFRRYARSVRNIACRILRNEAEAEDLLQEVFLRIFAKPPCSIQRPGSHGPGFCI